MFALTDGSPEFQEMQRELASLRHYLDNTLSQHLEKLEVIAERARQLLNGLRQGETGMIIEQKAQLLVEALADAGRPL